MAEWLIWCSSLRWPKVSLVWIDHLVMFINIESLDYTLGTNVKLYVNNASIKKEEKIHFSYYESESSHIL